MEQNEFKALIKKLIKEQVQNVDPDNKLDLGRLAGVSVDDNHLKLLEMAAMYKALHDMFKNQDDILVNPPREHAIHTLHASLSRIFRSEYRKYKRLKSK